MPAFLQNLHAERAMPAQLAVEGVAATGMEDDLGLRLGQILDLQLFGPVAALLLGLAHHVELVPQRFEDRLELGRQYGRP